MRQYDREVQHTESGFNKDITTDHFITGKLGDIDLVPVSRRQHYKKLLIVSIIYFTLHY